MKTLRLVSKLFGISLLILGFNSSCKKDKDDDDGGCITCTIDLTQYGLGSYSYTYCENDPSKWEDDFDSWEDVQAYTAYMDANYSFVNCN